MSRETDTRETDPDTEDFTPEPSEADSSLESRLQQAVDTRRQERQQAEASETHQEQSSLGASPIGEEDFDEEPIEDPHSDLPDGPPDGVSPAAERRLQDAVEANRRRREQAEFG